MAQSRRPRDLNTPVTRFPKRLYESLRAFLDKEDATAERDWRLLVVKLKLCESDVEIVQKSEEKTRVALELWEQQVGPDEGNGYGLVRILRDMKRFDVVKEVERFLGIANPTSDKLKMDFRVIDEAARQGDNKTLKKVIGDKTGKQMDEEFNGMSQSPLHSAVYYSHYSTVQFLVKKGFDVYRLNVDGKTPRQLADEQDHDIIDILERAETRKRVAGGRSVAISRTELDDATFKGDIEQMRMLLLGICDVDQAAPAGIANTWTPLHTAAGKGDLRAVKLLVEHGANIEKQNWEGFTPEDLARKQRNDEVNAFLRKEREKLEQTKQKMAEDRAKLQEQSITVYHPNEEENPFEFRIQARTLTAIMKGISDTMGLQVKALKNKRNGARIVQTRDFLFVTDVIACLGEEIQLLTPDVSVAPPMESLQETSKQGKFTVSIQHFRTYWTRPPKEFEFALNANYDAILDEVSRRLELPVHCLYTSEKLSKIRQTGVLVTKNRVIAASKDDKIRKEECGTLNYPKFFGAGQSKVFGNDGGTLFDFEHGVHVELPPGAVEQDCDVRMMVQVTAIDKRMDLSNGEWSRVYPIGLPVFVQTEPRGYRFHQPVKLRIPHCGVYESNWHPRNIAVFTASASVPLTSQLVFERSPQDQFEVTDSHVVIIQSFKFSWFWVFTEGAVLSRQCTVALYTPSDEAARQAQDTIHVKMSVFPSLHLYSAAADEALSKGDAPDRPTQYVLRARKRFVVTSQGRIDVEIENKGSVDWKIMPANLGISFDEVWNVLYRSRQKVYEVDITMQWLPEDDKKNTVPIQLEFCLRGQDAASRACKLGLFINLPTPDSPTRGLLPPETEEKLARLLDPIGGEENDRGWYALGMELGLIRDQLENLKGKSHRTRDILSKFTARRGEIREVDGALEHLGYERTT